jgi:hypothetical protein
LPGSTLRTRFVRAGGIGRRGGEPARPFFGFSFIRFMANH